MKDYKTFTTRGKARKTSKNKTRIILFLASPLVPLIMAVTIAGFLLGF